MYVVLLAVALVVAALVTRQVLLARLDAEIDASLAQEVEELRILAGGVDPVTGQPFGDDLARIFDTFLARNVPIRGEAFYTVLGGRPYASSAEAPADLLEDAGLVAGWGSLEDVTLGRLDTTAGDVRTLAVPLLEGTRTRGTFVVAFFPAAARADILNAVRTVAGVGFGVLVLSGIAAWSLAGRVLRPVKELTATARRINDTELSARIPVEGHDELAELSETFNAMVDRLEMAIGGQRAFMDDVAHELRTPITIIRGHLELLGEDPTERAETVALVTDELDRMSRYVNDLLLLAKAEAPDFLTMRPVDARELADGLLACARGLSDRSWTLHCPTRAGEILGAADPGRLTQAMVNLMQNSVQHTAPGDPITIGVAPAGDRLRLWVRDRGPGVDPAEQARLFERHARTAGSRRRRPDGTGLGLAIVAAVAQAHGGTVGVDSKRGSGATFTIDIPFDGRALA
jgi:signal transduction histidine kinase